MIMVDPRLLYQSRLHDEAHGPGYALWQHLRVMHHDCTIELEGTTEL